MNGLEKAVVCAPILLGLGGVVAMALSIAVPWGVEAGFDSGLFDSLYTGNPQIDAGIFAALNTLVSMHEQSATFGRAGLTAFVAAGLIELLFASRIRQRERQAQTFS